MIFKAKLSSPFYRLIARTALDNRGLLTLNIVANLGGAIFEGSTLGIIYAAVLLLNQETLNAQQLGPLAHPWIMGVLDSWSKEQVFFSLLAVATILQLLLSISGYVNSVSAAYFSARLQPQVTGKVFRQIMRFSFACASRYKVGDLVQFANTSASTVDRQIQILNTFLVNLSFALLYFFVMLRLSSSLTLLLFVPISLMILVQRWIIPRVHQVAAQLNLAQVEVAKQITENIQALRLLHSFGTQQRSISQVISQLQEVQLSLQKRARILFLPEPILNLFPILTLAILSALIYLFSPNPATVLPMLLTFLLALQRLAIRLKSIATAFNQLADNSALIHRVNYILGPQDKEFSRRGGLTFKTLETDIGFENVSLSYLAGQPVLQNLNFKILQNQVTALVGQSGAGKSSIADLLVGLYEPTTGDIMLNGKNLKDYDLASWGQCIGVVSQDTFIFNTTIVDNIRYGCPDETLDAVVRAAKQAQAHSFICQLPDGYDTVVGERGYRLSGGQRQRLALARAILKQPQVLILDEATSALDSESERLVQQAIADFQRDRTVLVIAHRLSTIVSADQIVVLENGQILEQGRHQALLRRGGRYAQYWDLQTQGVAV